ncbi:transcription cofactor vestigial-like protein 1 [Nothobranchius furzeri]|uniref:Vestigial like family member 1 n=1 Tax=Nothobranchius furzeri TaxID=105023 RepID=A0A9D3C483_NOTFU|nr:transcription cofactor vestigial-like protein 1 [Nothobranchius furzeri]XP_054595208.1 transcription cofactor vestigial-like protein 1 [Nothobranchius furzeri]KAF7228533.1 vestigial like family member 1 [Nothobranchius furzeri]
MEERTDSPIAVKVEGNSHSVILTYFQGDINSMVDAHFSRALSKACKPSEVTTKTKKVDKTVKTEDTGSCQDTPVVPYSKSQIPSGAGHLLTFSPASDTPGPWTPYRSREGPGLSTIMCSLSSDGLTLPGSQYPTSLLNLLHSDRSEVGPSMASSSKAEPLPTWTLPQGFRESADPQIGFEPGRHVDKKDLYWY